MELLQKIRKIFQSPALANIIRWSQSIHKKVLLICFISIVAVADSLCVTLCTKGLIDAAVSSRANEIWLYGGGLVFLSLLQIGLSFLSSIIHTHASANFQRTLRKMLAESILCKEYIKLKSYHSGELVNRIFSDAGVVHDGVLGILPSVMGTLVSFLGAATILIVLDWRFVLLMLGAGLIGLIIVILFRKPFKARHKRLQKAADGLQSVVQETFENIRLIKASVSEKRVLRQIDNKQQILEKEQIRQGKFTAIMNNSMGLMFDLSWLFCMLWGCFAIFRGEMTYGSLAAMIQLIGRVQGPIASAVSIAGEAYRVISSAERLMELTELPTEEEGKALHRFDEIRIAGVSFRYDDGTEDVLHDIDCTIQRGDFVALTGTSGGGKTSLFHLLLGIYKPQKGKVFFTHDGKETIASRDTRSLFAYVPQGNTLFSGTLRENLTMFTDQVSEEEIKMAIREACIEDLVAEVGLDAELGERGVGISEGQAQRVAVARALLTKAPILLLDESTSALDEETEARMLKNISSMREKTVLIVTHRRAALSICDYQLHVKEGAITKISASLTEKEEPCIITTELPT